jgi:nucleotide-binding universal stress UspA family protein
MHFDKILVPTDFSPDSLSVVETAAYQSKMSGAQVTLLHVALDWQVPATLYEYIPDPKLIDEYRKNVRDSAQKQLDRLAQENFHGLKVKTEVLMTVRSIGQTICDFAKESGVGLIIMSTHGHGALATLFMGSVASKVLQLSECPVLFVPRQKAGKK